MITVNGSSATDKPTLKTMLKVGDGTVATTMTFQANSQPLVVAGGGAITVNANGKIVFANTPPTGQKTVTAISNGDSQAHSIIINGGLLYRTDRSECYVGMGVQVNSGNLNVDGPPFHDNTDGPLHLTGLNADGFGLDALGGTVTLTDNLSVDNGAYISGGVLNVFGTLTLGVGAASPYSRQFGGVVNVGATILAHGGLKLLGGNLMIAAGFGTWTGTITVDSGNQVWLDGGEIDITAPTGAVGSLTINGVFNATEGKVVNNVDSTAGATKHGNFLVNGNVNLAADVIFSCSDISGNPTHHNEWIPFQWVGTRTGSYTFALPAGWTYAWDDVDGILNVFEP